MSTPACRLPNRLPPLIYVVIGCIVLAFANLELVHGFSTTRPRLLPLIASSRTVSITIPGTDLNLVSDIRFRMVDSPVTEWYRAANSENAPCSAAPNGLSLLCREVGPFPTAGYVQATVGVGTNYSDWTVVAHVDARILASSTEFFIEGSGFTVPISVSFMLTGASSASLASITCALHAADSLRCIAANGLPSSGILSVSLFETGQVPSEFVAVSYVDPVVTPSSKHYAISATVLSITGFGFGVTGQTTDIVLSPAPALGTILATRENGRVIELNITRPVDESGPLLAQIVVNGRTSGIPSQIGLIVPDPVITSSLAGISTKSNIITIFGAYFGESLAELSVTLSSGACSPTAIDSLGTQLICTITTKPAAGDLVASVSRAGGLPVSGLVGVVATPPTVFSRPQNFIDYRSRTVVITGVDFSSRNGTINTIILNDNIPCLQRRVALSGNSLECEFEDLSQRLPVDGRLLVTYFVANGISADGISSDSPLLVALLKVPPRVTSTTKSLLYGTSQALILTGTGFSAIPSENSVSLLLADFATAITCVPTMTSFSSIQCSIAPGVWNVHGPVVASVTSFGLPQEDGLNITSRWWTQAGTVRSRPQISPSTVKVPIHSPTLTIRGSFFSDFPLDANDIKLYQYGVTGSCSVLNASSDAIVCVPSISPQTVGPLSATIVVDDIAMSANWVVPVQVAELDNVPAVAPNLKSIPINSTSITIQGLFFSPALLDNYVTFVDNSLLLIPGAITFANETLLVFQLRKPLAVGEIFVSNITSHGMSNTSLVQVASALPYPRVFVPEQLDYDSALGPIQTLTIQGAHFSSNVDHVAVSLSSGQCKQVVLATNETIVCNVDGLSFEGGLLLVRVTILDGVSSLWQPHLRLRPTIITTFSPLPINSHYLIIHGFHLSSNISRLRVDLDRFTSCELYSATPSRLNCTLRDKPDLVGPLQALVTLRKTETSGPPSVYLSDTVVVASVVPVLEMPVLPEILANATSLVLYGDGFSSRPLFNRIELLPSRTYCSVQSLTATSVVCTITPGDLVGGSLSAQLSVYAEDVSQWFSAVQPSTVGFVKPVILVEPTQVPIVETPVLITGFGFSPDPADIVVSLRPEGECTPFSSSTVGFNCSLRGAALGPLYAVVSTRNYSSEEAQIASIIIPLPPPSVLTPAMINALNAVGLGNAPIDRNVPVDGGVYHVQMVAGAILGMILMVLMAIPLIVVVAFVFYLKQREQNSALYRLFLGIAARGNPSATESASVSTPTSPQLSPETGMKHSHITSEEIKRKQFGKVLAYGLKRANSDASESEFSRDDDDDVLPDDFESEPDIDDSDTNTANSTPMRADASVDLSFTSNTPSTTDKGFEGPPSPKRVLFSPDMPSLKPSTQSVDDEDDDTRERHQSLSSLRPATPRFTFTAIRDDDEEEDTLPSSSTGMAEERVTDDENFDLPPDDDDEADEKEKEYLASISRLKNSDTSTSKPVDAQTKTVAVTSSAVTTKGAALVVPLIAVSTATPLRSALKRKEPTLDSASVDLKRKVSFVGSMPATPPDSDASEPAVARKLSFPAEETDESMISLDDDIL